MTNPYIVLGVSDSSSDKEIKNAYRSLSKKYHPDGNSDEISSDKFVEINEAYNKISTEEKRQKYKIEEQMGSFIDFKNINSTFSSFFHAQRQMVNININISVAVSLKDAFHGKTISIPINYKNIHQIENVTIPPGVVTGETLVIHGKGDNTYTNLPPGDLYVSIYVQPDETFKLVGNDLFTSMNIDLKTALLGGVLEFNNFLGKKKSLPINKNMKNKSTIRVSGEGYLDRRMNRRGDLYIQIEVNLPILDDSQQEYAKEFFDKIKDN